MAEWKYEDLPQRWVAKANWKGTAENFAADPYHVQTTHRSTVEMGISPEDPLYAGYGHQVVLENGHGINVITSKTGKARVPFQSTPESMWPMFERNLTPEQLDIQSRGYCFCRRNVSKSLFCKPDSWDRR